MSWQLVKREGEVHRKWEVWKTTQQILAGKSLWSSWLLSVNKRVRGTLGFLRSLWKKARKHMLWALQVPTRLLYPRSRCPCTPQSCQLHLKSWQESPIWYQHGCACSCFLPIWGHSFAEVRRAARAGLLPVPSRSSCLPRVPVQPTACRSVGGGCPHQPFRPQLIHTDPPPRVPISANRSLLSAEVALLLCNCWEMKTACSCNIVGVFPSVFFYYCNYN